MTVFVTYDDGNRLEDVMRSVVQVTPTDTPFMSGVGKTKATNTLHEWPEDTLTTRADNAVVEGSAFSYGTLSAPSRVNNFTQIFAETYQVSSTNRWTPGAGVDDQYLYQESKAIKQIATDIEHALLRGSKASGNASTARRLGGMLNFVTTNATAVASGTKLTESFFAGLQELVWIAGGKVDEVYVNSKLKRIISGYTAGVQKNVDAFDARMINKLDVYESDFGMVRLYLSRDMLSGTNAASILLCDSTKNYMAVGEPVRVLSREEVAQTGHGTNGVIRGEVTLEVRAERHQAKATALSELFN